MRRAFFYTLYNDDFFLTYRKSFNDSACASDRHKKLCKFVFCCFDLILSDESCLHEENTCNINVFNIE